MPSRGTSWSIRSRARCSRRSSTSVRSSTRFGIIETLTLDASEPTALFIPKGLANSICVAGDQPVNYLYLVDSYYDGTDLRAVAWDDPDLAIDWPIDDPILSDRDRANPTLRELFPERFEA